MKIAVIFLCVAIASFIDTSNGFSKGKSFDKTKADFYVRSCHAIGQKVEILKTCPEHERETRKKCLLEDVLLELNLLSIDMDCTLEEVLKIVGLPLEIVNCILTGNLDDILTLISIEGLISPVLLVVEGCLGKVGIVLKEQLELLNGVLIKNNLDMSGVYELVLTWKIIMAGSFYMNENN
ncbi:unnamed protein product [Ranitomeya imitator]|uniref:Secreted protein n=1 Tax=Ranitomeya imitator TaxID=111125 RepID=A0ABN9L8V1_9NEOB|nr:unnamed protein product [Ranitomeya imitator]